MDCLVILFTSLFLILNSFYIRDNKTFLDESDGKMNGFYDINYILRCINIIMNLLFLLFFCLRKQKINKYILYYSFGDNSFNVLFYLFHNNIDMIIFQFLIYIILLLEYIFNIYNESDVSDIDQEIASSAIHRLPTPTISVDSIILDVEPEIESEPYGETNEGTNAYGENIYDNSYDEGY